MFHNGDGLHFVLYVCALSKAGQWGSQEQYQRTLPPREMSSRSRRLWDCCRHPSSLWMSASLTGQLAYMAPLTTQLHFQLLFINFFPPFSPQYSASEWQRGRQTRELFWLLFTSTVGKICCICTQTYAEVNIGWGNFHSRRCMPWDCFVRCDTYKTSGTCRPTCCWVSRQLSTIAFHINKAHARAPDLPNWCLTKPFIPNSLTPVC